MRLTPEILSLFRCPSCSGHLKVIRASLPEADGHVLGGELACACGQRYAIERGVPRFLLTSLAKEVESTVSGFGFQWNRAKRVLADKQFCSREVFLDFVAPVQPDYFAGKVVLDGGCGLGRFTRLAADFGARVVVGVDLSSAVDAAFAATRHLENAVIVQADLFNLPFNVCFDYAFSVGVLHHTPDPRAAFAALVRHVRPKGGISAWVYGREGNDWILRFLDPIRRWTSKLPRPFLLALAYAVAAPIHVMIRVVYQPARHIRVLRERLFYFDYFMFVSQFGYRELAYIVFDHAVPQLAFYIARDEFVEWFKANALRDVRITSRSGNSWRGFGVRVA